MFLVVVLIFGVGCSAFPTSDDGAKCLVGCYFNHNGTGGVTDSPLVAGRSRAQILSVPGGLSRAYHDCDFYLSFLACTKSCSLKRRAPVLRQITALVKKECSPSVSEEQRAKFLKSFEDLNMKLNERSARCWKREPNNDEGLCKNVASCMLGSALDELKADYPKDVVTLVADATKLTMSMALKDPKTPPEACSVLYEPYKARVTP